MNTTFITKSICFQLRQFSGTGEKLKGFVIPLKKLKIVDQIVCSKWNRKKEQICLWLSSSWVSCQVGGKRAPVCWAQVMHSSIPIWTPLRKLSKNLYCIYMCFLHCLVFSCREMPVWNFLMYEYFYEAFLRVFFDVIGRGSGFLIIIFFFLEVLCRLNSVESAAAS